MKNILKDLNKEQKKAVTHDKGPLLIIAGAGTGKTSVITRRIAWLISEGLAKTSEILALTFTDKAALEMLERVDVLVPYGYTDICISTFHAFGDRLLRENALAEGLNPDFKVLTRPETAVFLREHLFELELLYYRPLSDPTRFIEALISVFSRAKDEDISPEEYIEFAGKLMLKAKNDPQDKILAEYARQQKEIASSYSRYQELLITNGLVDFGNQFYLSLKLLREHPLILKNYQKQFKYIMVDEFQDTNFAQYRLVKLLASRHQNITVTGDDDQCIYRFRGAAYSNLLNFIQDFSAVEKISISRNYRSSQAILDAAYKLIQNNNPERFEVKANINKKLTALSKGKVLPQHKHFDTGSTEADWIAQTIYDKVKTKKFTYKDFAILVRSNSNAVAFLQALNMKAIPWQFSGNRGLYSQEEVKLCINFLRVIANFSDSLSLYYLSSSEIYRLDLADLALCMHYAKRRNKSLHVVFKDADCIKELSQISDESRKRIKNILIDIDKFLKISRNETTGRLLYSFLTRTDYLKNLTKSINLEKEAKIQNLAKFFNIVRNFELVATEDRVINFVTHINLLIEAGDDPATAESDLDTDSVNVLTIHKAKGLEFRVVFLVGLVNGRFPLSHRKQTIPLPGELIKEILPTYDFHIHEERRLFYVGMTRAKEELYLTSAVDYGGVRMRRVSQFVIEALGDVIKQEDKERTSAIEAIKRFAPKIKSEESEIVQIPQDKLLNLSFYQIDDYLTCSLKYKYVHILRVPIMEHHTVIYGRAMHEAVTKYFQFKLSGKDMALPELLERFSSVFDPQGFLDDKHQQACFQRGKDALVRFFDAEKEGKSRIQFIEKDFSFIFENNKIRGRFDRIDVEEDDAIIIDFKTSATINKQKDADKRVKESLQLDLYALAYRDIFGQLPKRVELHFLESGLIGGKAKEDKDLDKARDKIRRVSLGLRKREFGANPSYMACRYCAYNQICPSVVSR